MQLEHLYSRLPIFLQNATCNLEGWRIKRMRFNNVYYDYLNDVESRSYFSIDEIREYRDKRLHNFIKHSYKSVPFYKNMFDNLKIHPNDIHCLNDLYNLPILNKETVQNNYRNLLSSDVPKQ
jgi:phenylacetate-CoA ligase